jgi:hypothetical protein
MENFRQSKRIIPAILFVCFWILVLFVNEIVNIPAGPTSEEIQESTLDVERAQEALIDEQRNTDIQNELDDVKNEAGHENDQDELYP